MIPTNKTNISILILSIFGISFSQILPVQPMNSKCQEDVGFFNVTVGFPYTQGNTKNEENINLDGMISNWNRFMSCYFYKRYIPAPIQQILIAALPNEFRHQESWISYPDLDQQLSKLYQFSLSPVTDLPFSIRKLTRQKKNL